MNRNNRRTGGEYEEMAAQFLESCGFLILERNYRNRVGEIDIIALDQRGKSPVLVFVEIKYRAGLGYGAPEDAVNLRKQRNISRVALYYYAFHGAEWDLDCRFDVICILGDGTLEHIENAFEFVDQ